MFTRKPMNYQRFGLMLAVCMGFFVIVLVSMQRNGYSDWEIFEFPEPTPGFSTRANKTSTSIGITVTNISFDDYDEHSPPDFFHGLFITKLVDEQWRIAPRDEDFFWDWGVPAVMQDLPLGGSQSTSTPLDAFSYDFSPGYYRAVVRISTRGGAIHLWADFELP